MNSVMTEMELCDSAEKYFAERKWKVYREVPFRGGCTDMFLTHRDNQTIIGIEFKLRDWKRAFRQAIGLRSVTQFPFVAMPPYKKTPPKLLEWAKCLGIGLMFFNDGRLQIAVRPAKKNYSEHPIPEWWRAKLLAAFQYVEEMQSDRFPNELWSDWARRHSVYKKPPKTAQ